MEAVESVFSKPELVEAILNKVPVAGLVNCSLVNWTWNMEAVTILNKKAIMNLDFDERKISYLEMIRAGGRCHDRIALTCLGDVDHPNSSTWVLKALTTEQFQILLSAIDMFGATRIKKLTITLKFVDGSPSPEEFQPIFTAAQNIEELKLDFEMTNELAATSALSCFPERISFDCLRVLSFVELTPRPSNETAKRIFFTKLVGIFPNLAELTARGNNLGIFLEEMGKTPGRLEKIAKITAFLPFPVPKILLESEFPNLKILYFGFYVNLMDKVALILEKHKDTLVELRFAILPYQEVLKFPKSMGKLQKIHVHFEGGGQPCSCPLLKFPILAEYESDGDFYPNLKTFKLDGQHPERFRKYLAAVFPGRYRCGNNANLGQLISKVSEFSSVRCLDLSSDGEDWSDILDDEETRRRLMHYFPNADFEAHEMIHTPSEEWESYDSSAEYFSRGN